MAVPLVLVQMAGAPGSGKTHLGRALAGRLPAVVVNSDVVKSTLLDAGVEWELAGPAAYRTLFALADDLLAQGRSVILDSPSHYAFIPENGAGVARRRRAAYRFVECDCPDATELKRRLTERTPMRSQMRGLDEPPPDSTAPSRAQRVGQHRWRTFGPAEGHLVLDTSAALDTCVEQALAYVRAAP